MKLFNRKRKAEREREIGTSKARGIELDALSTSQKEEGFVSNHMGGGDKLSF